MLQRPMKMLGTKLLVIPCLPSSTSRKSQDATSASSVCFHLHRSRENSAFVHFVLIIGNSPEEGKKSGRCQQCATTVAECFTYQPLIIPHGSCSFVTPAGCMGDAALDEGTNFSLTLINSTQNKPFQIQRAKKKNVKNKFQN